MNPTNTTIMPNTDTAIRLARKVAHDSPGAPLRTIAERSPLATSTIRVLCVDDHAVLIEGLRAQFAIDGRIEIAASLPSALRLVEEATRLQPDIILLDIEMPGPDAFEMADRVCRAFPEIRVIFLSAHIRDAFITASFSTGACAYFSKSDELEDIVGVIHQVMRTKHPSFILGPKVRERCRPVLAGGGATRSAAKGARPGSPDADGLAPVTLLGTLTNREVEILRLIGKGLSRTQIATQLCRSAKTIDGHQERILKKLGIPSRADLMRFATREGLAQA